MGNQCALARALESTKKNLKVKNYFAKGSFTYCVTFFKKKSNGIPRVWDLLNNKWTTPKENCQKSTRIVFGVEMPRAKKRLATTTLKLQKFSQKSRIARTNGLIKLLKCQSMIPSPKVNRVEACLVRDWD